MITGVEETKKDRSKTDVIRGPGILIFCGQWDKIAVSCDGNR